MRSSLLLLTLLAAPLAAQQPTSPTAPATPAPPAAAAPRRQGPPPLRAPTADTGAFAHMDFRPGDDIRTADGRPGRAYWQQRADYDIQATLDTAGKKLTGTVRITYTNNSPDTLTHVYLQVDQNLFKQGSVGSLMFGANSRFGARNFDGGFNITRMVQETAAPAAGPRARAARPTTQTLTGRTDDTMLYLDLGTPLAPGKKTVLVLDYWFLIPEHGADRMGRDGALFELAQWYPRMAVYDDIRGWNTDQYLGQGEFYLEYGDITYAVTVPAGYVVAGTGMVQNPLEVYTAAQRARLAAALHSDTTIAIITQAELDNGSAHPTKTGTVTWRFKAENVRDAAWAASPDYRFDASGWEGRYAFAYYRGASAGTWADGAKMSRFSIKEYSERWFPYPYPQISAVEGPISGMEYPMVAMEAPAQNKDQLYNVVTHEIGHMWYPMIVGSNERLYAWMDEGFNTFVNTFSEEDYWSRSDTLQRRGEQRFVMLNDQQATAQAIMTPANRYRTNGNLGSLAYVKPSITLLTLRNVVLGPQVFDRAFSEYTHRWAFKHPTPADFFRTMEDMSGRDLSWFWREYFYTTATVDQAVDSVTNAPAQGGGNLASIVLKNNSPAVLPVQATLTLNDGSTQQLNLPVEVWYYDQTRFLATVNTPRPVTKVQLWTSGWIKDYVPANDTWTATP